MKILNGTKLAKSIQADLKAEIDDLNISPKLVVCLVGDDPASQVYVRYKQKACEEVGIESEVLNFSSDIEEQDLIGKIQSLSLDKSVNAILVQLPLPDSIDTFNVIDAIHPSKDVDCLTPYNQGLLALGEDFIAPCTPAGIIKLLEANEVSLEGKKAVVIGRSNIVGKPMLQLLLRANASVSVCHSRTTDITEFTKNADIIIVAAGKPQLLKKDAIKKGAVVVDVGIHRVEGGLIGDVDGEGLEDHVDALSPVPGGVGPMTIACLLENTLALYHYQDLNS